MIYALEVDKWALLFTKYHEKFTNKRMGEAKHDV